MSHISFSTCLANNTQLLGDNCANLGKTQGGGFLGLGRYKVMLSYSDSKGWSVKTLNVFQLFIRKYLSCLRCFKSTELKTVMQGWKKLLKKDEGGELFTHDRLRQIWQKRYFSALGNASESDANIFVFPEKHNDEVYRKSIAEIINRHYQNGDVILVEGQTTSENSPANEHEQTRYVKNDLTVQGWEPDNYKQLLPEAFQTNSKMLKNLHTLYATIESTIPEDENYTDADLEPLEKALPDFVKQYQELATYFKIENPWSFDRFNSVFQDFKSKKLSQSNENSKCFKYVLLRVLGKLEKNSFKSRFQYVTAADIEKLKGGIVERNSSLCREIDKCRQAGKKVFVIAGEGHILRGPELSDPKYTAEIQETLKKHKFTILTKRSRFEKEGLAKFNQGLNP